MDQFNVNFAVYEDGTEFYGMASVGMPTLANLIQSVNGAGIAGNIEAVALGHLEAMTLTVNEADAPGWIYRAVYGES